MKLAKAALAVAAASALTLAVSAVNASAVVGGPVSTTPANWTPWLLNTPVDQNVQQLVPCGANMYAVGTISAIGQGTKTYTRGNAFSFSQTTGALTSWDPQVNGKVNSIALSADCSTAYLGGKFSSVRGVAANNIVAVDTVTGNVKAGFAHSATNEVNTVVLTSKGLLVGGLFGTINGVARTRFASLDPVTGATTSYANLAITGSYPNTGTKVYNSQLSNSKTKLLIEGVFTSIAGVARKQVAVLDLGATSVTVNPWYSNEFNADCVDNLSFYVRGGAWSPDDSTIYVATTGYKPKSGPGSRSSDPRAGLCDAAAAFPSTAGLTTHKWINYTGCDSLYAVAADNHDVYIGGHERWANNGFGCDAAGPGALSRPGIASLSPTTGLATSWNPTRSLGHGVKDLEITPAGLWIASDTWEDGYAQKCGGVNKHGGICFFPY